MGENEKKILDMLAAGKISVDEAQRLLSLIGAEKNNTPNGETSRAGEKRVPKYFYVVVEPKPGAPSRPRPGSTPPDAPTPPGTHGWREHNAKVHVRVPFGLIRAGMRFSSLVPSEVSEKVNQAMKEKGINFDLRHIKTEDIEELISALSDSEVNIDADDETVRIYTE